MQNNDELFLPHEWTEVLALINKNRKEPITDEEQTRLNRWIERSEENKMLFEEMKNSDVVIEGMKQYADVIKRVAMGKDKVLPKPEEPLTDESGARISKLRFSHWAAAASILVVLSAAAYYILNSSKPQKAEAVVAEVKANDVAPGRQMAKLTLSNGKVVLLDKSTTGILATESGSEVFSKDGQLIYKAVQGVSDSELLFNTLTTGRGETFSTVLADGSTIWLNAGSSVRYPLVFGSERTVELEYGEAYLEVSHNKKLFTLRGAQGQVQVLGTRFNVREYADEYAMVTSLLEGKVKVDHGGNEQSTIMPGQQAVFNKNSQRLSVDKGDVEGAASWVHGVLHLENANLSEVLRELGRWYDVEIEFLTTSDVKMRGDFERNIPLSEMLDMLSRIALVNFKIEGKKIIVVP
jgi:ferric-dicitrate binding protein FerR (iron transport regulator)